MKRKIVFLVTAVLIWVIIAETWTSGGDGAVLISGVICAFFGWKVLNMIQPAMFIWMPFIGWIIYFLVKFIIAAIIGWFVTPFVIAKKICDSMNTTGIVEKNVKKDKSMTETENPSLLSKIRCQPCLASLVVCAVLWLAAPFLAINLASLYDGLPSALQTVTGDFSYIGELQESSGYWAAVISGIGIVACLILTVKRWARASRITAIVTEILMILTLTEVYDWLGGEGIGVGYWGILILFLVVIVFSKKKKPKESSFAGN